MWFTTYLTSYHFYLDIFLCLCLCWCVWVCVWEDRVYRTVLSQYLLLNAKYLTKQSVNLAISVFICCCCWCSYCYCCFGVFVCDQDYHSSNVKIVKAIITTHEHTLDEIVYIFMLFQQFDAQNHLHWRTQTSILMHIIDHRTLLLWSEMIWFYRSLVLWDSHISSL